MMKERRIVRLLACVLTLCVMAVWLTGCMTVNTYTGVRSAAFNEKGELVLTYEDGHTESVLLPDKGKNGSDDGDGSAAEAQTGDAKKTPSGTEEKAGETAADATEQGQDGGQKPVPTASVDELFPAGIATTAEVPARTQITEAASKGLRSAVSVICTYTVDSGSGSIYIPGFGYFGGSGSGNTQTQQKQSAGSGVIYRLNKENGDALIITNYHVVYSSSSATKNGIADEISVYLYGSEINGKGITASYVGGSMYYDIAVLYVQDSELLRTSCAEAVTFADSDEVNVGDVAIAIGNPEGNGTSVTSGTVSVDSEYITMTAADEQTSVSFRVIRVDTAVNSGNSGGGLYNADGNLIGIVNAKVSSSTVENIGYAIPSNVAAAIADNIIDYCFGTDCETVQRGLLGITVSTTDSVAYVEPTTGLVRICEEVTVYAVGEDGLADGVLEEGDIITAITIGGKTREITRQYQLIDAMLEVREGDKVTLTVVRDDKLQTVDFTVTADCITSY